MVHHPPVFVRKDRKGNLYSDKYAAEQKCASEGGDPDYPPFRTFLAVD